LWDYYNSCKLFRKYKFETFRYGNVECKTQKLKEILLELMSSFESNLTNYLRGGKIMLKIQLKTRIKQSTNKI